jgi:hypothetical protein
MADTSEIVFTETVCLHRNSVPFNEVKSTSFSESCQNNAGPKVKEASSADRGCGNELAAGWSDLNLVPSIRMLGAIPPLRRRPTSSWRVHELNTVVRLHGVVLS